MTKLKYIVFNKDFEEYVSSISPFIETSEFETDVFVFEDEVQAEEIRKQVQENTGNRWRVMPIKIGEDAKNWAFDEWGFIEKWLPNYYHCDEVALVDDIDKVLNNEYEEGDCCESFLNYTINELHEMRNQYMAGLLADAMANYIRQNYPTKEKD